MRASEGIVPWIVRLVCDTKGGAAWPMELLRRRCALERRFVCAALSSGSVDDGIRDLTGCITGSAGAAGTGFRSLPFAPEGFSGCVGGPSLKYEVLSLRLAIGGSTGGELVSGL